MRGGTPRGLGRGSRAARLAVMLGLLAPAYAALAQEEPARTVQRPQQNGLKVGDARMHVQADVDSRYATNPGRTSGTSGEGSPSDVVVAVRPAADLDMAGTLLELKLKGNFEYQRYLGIEN